MLTAITMGESRFNTARDFLIDLMRAYGNRRILVKTAKDGRLIEVMARTFVIRQLKPAAIPFPFNECIKKNEKIINSEIDKDELSIIFHKAVFDLELAYVEEFCQGNPEEEEFVNAVYRWIEKEKEWLQSTFSYYEGEELEPPFLEKRPEPELKKGDLSIGLAVNAEDEKALKKMGYPQISSINAMMQLFWAFASYRQPITKMMQNAILSITVDEDAAAYLTMYFHFYNRFIQEKIEKDAFPEDEKLIKKLTIKHRNELEALNKKHQDTYKMQRKKYEEALCKHKMKYKEVQADLQNLRHKVKERGIIIEKFRNLVINPHSKINQTYDLTNEKDIRDFISWFRVAKKKIKNQTVKAIVNVRFDGDEDSAELFKMRVEEYNSSLKENNVNTDKNEV